MSLQFSSQFEQALSLRGESFTVAALQMEINRDFDQPIHNFVGGGTLSIPPSLPILIAEWN